MEIKYISESYVKGSSSNILFENHEILSRSINFLQQGTVNLTTNTNLEAHHGILSMTLDFDSFID